MAKTEAENATFLHAMLSKEPGKRRHPEGRGGGILGSKCVLPFAHRFAKVIQLHGHCAGIGLGA